MKTKEDYIKYGTKKESNLDKILSNIFKSFFKKQSSYKIKKHENQKDKHDRYVEIFYDDKVIATLKFEGEGTDTIKMAPTVEECQKRWRYGLSIPNRKRLDKFKKISKTRNFDVYIKYGEKGIFWAIEYAFWIKYGRYKTYHNSASHISKENDEFYCINWNDFNKREKLDKHFGGTAVIYNDKEELEKLINLLIFKQISQYCKTNKENPKKVYKLLGYKLM